MVFLLLFIPLGLDVHLLQVQICHEAAKQAATLHSRKFFLTKLTNGTSMALNIGR
jgi:hypothetical protein